MRRFIALGTGIIALALGICQPSWADPTIEETVVAPGWEQGTTYVLSPKGLHVGAISQKGSRFVVTVDGVEGPKLDEVLMGSASGATLVSSDYQLDLQEQNKWQAPIAFSTDGTRYAYAGRVGAELLVICDGKEIFRQGFNNSQQVQSMTFTPDGKHLIFFAASGDVQHPYQIILDGERIAKPLGAWSQWRFSPDGAHWATAQNMDETQIVIVDGKEAGYAALAPRFTPDNRLVTFTLSSLEALVDGKPLVKASRIESCAISSTGDIAIIATDQNNKKQLTINGQPAPGGEDAALVTFSPDGKHWAANCFSAPRAWVVVDGKKQSEYNGIEGVAWSPDSSKCVYIATMGQKKFVVANGEEEDGNPVIAVRPFFSETGNHHAYVAGQGAGALQAYVDGKVMPKTYLVFNFTFSKDGARNAYYAAHDALSSALYVDGEAKGGAGGQPSVIFFSADGKHVAAFAQSPTDRNASLFIDGDYAQGATTAGYPRLLGFTADSNHLLMDGTEDTGKGVIGRGVYVDNKRVALFSRLGVTWAGAQGNQPTLVESYPDGTIVLVGAEATGAQTTGPMKRIKITPDASFSASTIVSDYKSAVEAKAKADAEAKAAKEKAAADKAAADKAAYDKAIADRKAAYDKAVADKKAAREKALADQKAAKEKAAADKAAAQQQKSQ